MNAHQFPWGVSTLSGVAHLEMGQSPDGQATNTDGEGIPLIGGAADYNKERIEASRYTTQPTKVCRKGDLILCIRATIGKVAIADKEYCLGRGVAGLRPSKVSPDFLRYFLNSQANALDEAGTGTTFRQIDKKTLSSWPIGVPGANEQRRIVAKLDNLFKYSKSARDELARIPRLVERYKQAILATAFRGDATANWRIANPAVRSSPLIEKAIGMHRKREGGSTSAESAKVVSLPRTWRTATVESIGEVILGRQRSPENHSGPNMRPYVRAANITWDGWDLSDVKKMNFDKRDFEKFKLQSGDVLINEGSGSADEVGKPAIWNGGIENCCFQNTLIAVRPHATTPEYLYFVLLNAALSKAFVDEARGVNIHHIGRAGLAQFIIPVPPSEEQEEIVRRIKDAFSAIDQLAAETSRATQLLDRLNQATLAKAFRGELVSAGPNDESGDPSLMPAESPVPSISQQQLIGSRRKLRMSDLTPESVVKAIGTLPQSDFTFDDLRAHLPGDYERLKDIVFGLLSAPQPSIVQRFDPHAKAMRFQRVS